MDSEYVRRLSDVDERDTRRAGSKASNLGGLLRAGFPVPDGFVVTTEAFDQFMRANNLSAASPPEAAEAAVVPQDVCSAIHEAATALATEPLAVRSSGVAEDLAGASYAGQYETVLGVKRAAVSDAVRECWVSAFSTRVTAYQAGQGQSHDEGRRRMAVLVQRQVAADAAGVAFTANPVSGDRDEVVVSAVRGLGERLVSGHASPDEWLVRGKDAICRAGPEAAIDASQAGDIAALGRRVEAHFGAPQDIEWAIVGDELFLLQARPITTLSQTSAAPVEVDARPPAGFWQREASHYPRPFSPLFRSVFLPAANAALRRAFAEAGLLVEGIEHREIGGWVYIRLVPLGGKDRSTPPTWLMRGLRRVLPSLRSRIAQCVDAVRSDQFTGYVDAWYDVWRPELATRTERLREVDLGALSDIELDGHVEHVLELVAEAQVKHQLLAAAVSVSLADLAFTCRDLLGWDDQRTFALLAGLSDKSTEAARRLAELAQLASSNSAVLSELDRIDASSLERLSRTDPPFAAAFEAYQRETGGRVLRYEVAEPTPLETPNMTLRLVRDQLASRYDPQADAVSLQAARLSAIGEARSALALADLARFDRALARAERAYPVREDNGFLSVASPLALVRYAALEVGRRLAERGTLDTRDDVFFLELPETRTALRDAASNAWRAVVARRKGERAWIEAHPGPASYGQEPPRSHDLRWLPAEARFAMEAMIWVVDRITAADESGRQQTGDDNLLHGIGASPGCYTGPARVLLNEDDFERVQPGDVLVCPITSPAWSVLFPRLGGLVTDTGGILSHPAIIAREYRVPAVVATGTSTRHIRDGDLVTVDGNAGIVRLA